MFDHVYLFKNQSTYFRFAMEMHMVHINTKYTNNVTAAYENPDGFAVIGIFGMVEDYNNTNKVFDPVVEAANELIADPEAKVEKTLNLQDFLDQVEGSNYFSYQGSLTTPGCYEAVSWIIMDQPVLIAESQVLKNSGSRPDQLKSVYL